MRRSRLAKKDIRLAAPKETKIATGNTRLKRSVSKLQSGADDLKWLQ